MSNAVITKVRLHYIYVRFFHIQKVVFRLLTTACVKVEICVCQKNGKNAQNVYIVGSIESNLINYNTNR